MDDDVCNDFVSGGGDTTDFKFSVELINESVGDGVELPEIIEFRKKNGTKDGKHG